MNRLVIIGNGFDLAHGLPTGYCDFIDGYWRKVISSITLFEDGTYKGDFYEDEIIRIDFKFQRLYFDGDKTILKEFENVNSFNLLIEFLNKYRITENQKRILSSRPNVDVNNCRMTFKNIFFKLINTKQDIQKWVDIENEYYILLKDCLEEKNNAKVKKLNEEFEQVKKLLGDYLYNEINEKFDFDNPNNEIEQMFNLFNIIPDSRGFYLKEFPNEDQIELKDSYNIAMNASRKGVLKKEIGVGNINQQNLFLNFNYTPTIDFYIEAFARSKTPNQCGFSQQIQIHGKLKDPNNLVNFGFGDEMDDAYKTIENKDDNEYLRNIKSFQYFQNSNYKDMLDFIESEKFQVYIMGHSCGLSDRILLNKIFEHHNCRSIKVFYYKNGDWDNYTEIVQNISRHFNKKEMMREKIVNKSLCQPLPQDVRFAPKQ